jgi:hypothetical protein
MRHPSVVAALLVLAAAGQASADEGMWPPDQLPEIAKQLRAAGLRLDASRLADLDEEPLGAVISLGGCTASFVSPEGLAITNHHCAESAIQYNSTPERNLMKTGFLARTRDEELFAGPGSRILVTVEVRDVTGDVLGGLGADVHGKARFDAIEKRTKDLVAAGEAPGGVRCRVAAFHGGLQYKLITQMEIRDVRIVYAPAEGIGNYGGEVDNWMWPRHTGDFTFYRAYVGPNGLPADHARENVPYRPKRWLRVQPAGVHEGDFVLSAGYPGTTSRYRTAREVENAFAWRYPTTLERNRTWIYILERETQGRPEAAIKVARQVSGLNNTSKNYQGMLDGAARSGILPRRRAEEASLRQWIDAEPERRARYGSALADLDALVEHMIAGRERDLHYEMLARSSRLLDVAVRAYRLSREREKPDAEREPGYQERDEKRLRETFQRLDRGFDPQADRAVAARFIVDYAAIPVEQHDPVFDRWFGIEAERADGERVASRLAEMYAATGLADQATRLAWLDKSAAEIEASDDPFLQLAVALYPGDRAEEAREEELRGRDQELRPRYMEALVAFRKSQGRPVAPDANGTLRVSYGKVTGASPRDGLVYQPFTTVAGLLAKETGKDPFASPQALLDAVKQGRFGAYRDARLGTLPVNHLTNLDTTGGNSGSPTLNAKGEFVGIGFDRTYEGIDSSWSFDPEVGRAIHVDVRYILWILDEVDGAGHLLREMGLQSGMASRE